MRSFVKEYVGEQETGFCHPKLKWSSSAGAVDRKANHLLSSRKPHPTLGCLCCWRALGWDQQIWRECDSAARLGKLCCFISASIQGAHGWDGGLHGREEDIVSSEPIQSLLQYPEPLMLILQSPFLNSTYTWLITAEIPSGVSSLHVYYSFVYFFININCCYLCKPVHLDQFWWALKAPNWK